MTPASVARSSSSALETPSARSTQRKYPPSGRLHVARPAAPPRERVEHRVRWAPRMPAHAVEVRLEAAAGVELVHDRLRQERRRDVRRDRAVVVARREAPRARRSSRRAGPGATVFENDEVNVTCSPPSSSCSDGARRPRSGRARTGRPRARRGRARGRARRRAGGAPRRACARSGSGRSGSCRGTRRRRRGASSASSASRSRPSRRPSRAARPRRPASRGASAAGRRSGPRRARGPGRRASCAAT